MVQNKIKNFPPKLKYNSHSLPLAVALKIRVVTRDAMQIGKFVSTLHGVKSQ